MTRRRYLTQKQKVALWRSQGECCAKCKDILSLAGAEFDHMHGLWCGGGHEGNFQALCGPCHTAKTGSETTARAHVKRLRRKRLGVARKRRYRGMKSRPFQKWLRKKLDGTVEERT